MSIPIYFITNREEFKPPLQNACAVCIHSSLQNLADQENAITTKHGAAWWSFILFVLLWYGWQQWIWCRASIYVIPVHHEKYLDFTDLFPDQSFSHADVFSIEMCDGLLGITHGTPTPKWNSAHAQYLPLQANTEWQEKGRRLTCPPLLGSWLFRSLKS